MKKLVYFYSGLLILFSVSFAGLNKIPSLASLACSELLQSVEISEVNQLIEEGIVPLCLFKDIKLNGGDLSELVVLGGRFTDCEFKNVKFRQSNFSDTLFKNVVFESCDLSDAILEAATFEDCHFMDVSLERADIRNICLNNNIFKKTKIGDLRLLKNFTIKNDSFSSSLIYEILKLYSSCTDMKNKYVNLGQNIHAGLYDRVLRVLNQIILPSIDLNCRRMSINDRMFLWKLNLSGINLQGVDLFCHFLQSINLSGADLRNAKLRFVDLSIANLKGANLQGADLFNARLSGADLRNANLEDCNLMYASLKGAMLTNSNFENAKLIRTDLRNTDLTTVNFQNAVLEKGGLNLDGARCPESWNIDELQTSGKDDQIVTLLIKIQEINSF